jgi:hypothetical protein
LALESMEVAKKFAFSLWQRKEPDRVDALHLGSGELYPYK